MIDQIKELESFIQPLEKNISTLKEQISKLEFEKQTALSLISNYMAEKNSYEVKLAEGTEEFDKLSLLYSQISNEKITFESNVDFTKMINENLARKSDLSVQLRTQKEILRTTEEQYYQTIVKKNELDEELKQLLDENGKKIGDKARAETIIDSAKKRLSEQYGLLFETAQQYYKPDIDFDVARKLVENLKQDIRELGHINLEAIQQLEEVQTRYDEVKTQEDRSYI